MKQNKNNLNLNDLKPGTVLFMKILLCGTLLLVLSFYISRLFLPFGLIVAIYLGLFVIPFSILTYSSISYTIFPLYLWLLINYWYLSKKKMIYIKLVFFILTLFYVIATLLGLFLFLVDHPP